MSNEAAERWDTRYREDPRYSRFEQPRSFLLEQAHLLPDSGLAIDAAMGLGGNAAFLLERGLRVIGVDISGIGLRRATRRLPALIAVQADLANFHLPSHRFDVILNFYYLEHSLWPQYIRALRPGGLLIFETLTRDMLSLQPEIDPAFLLQPGELRQAFPGLETLVYREGWAENERGFRRAVASLAAKAHQIS